MTSLERYWLRHETETWITGTIQSEDDVKVVFKAANNDIITLPASQFKDLQQVSDDQLLGVDDVCSLVNVNEGALLWTVRHRYQKKLIYTRVARTIIAVNPFTSLPIYSSQTVDQYTNCTDSSDLPPHIFAIGQDAIRGLRDTPNDQAVLISGESGAGKTESAKLIMAFVTDAMRTSQGDRMENVLRTNIVLEAFGNAMTVRNNNSSRFGKWLDLHFSRDLQSVGATITSYLLETTRVVDQATKERGYHVFFQLLQAREKFPGLDLEDSKKYGFLNKGLAKAPGIDDGKNFDELQQALGHFGIDGAKQLEVWTILAAILSLGNIEFKEVGEGSEVINAKPLEKLASLLQVDAKAFLSLMTIRKVVVGKEVTAAKNRVDQARGVRDALARLLYGKLFLWLISSMNELLTGNREHESSDRLIGVLDIAGFECFEFNSLEQLLINLSNEHLQQHFNDSMIKSEEAECLKEGVILPAIEGFNDNADILTLIDSDKKDGVLDILDEVCLTKFSNATDLSYVGKVTKAHSGHNRLIVAKSTTKAEFGIKHFAGDVTYTCDGWMDKNLEKLPLDTIDVFKSSGIELMTDLSEAMETTTPAGGAKGGRAKSVTGGFRSSLKELMTKIRRANPHYIRCVKPNVAKETGKFTPPLVMEQLLFGGMLAAVNIRQQGYSYRLPHKDFITLYACIAEQLEAHPPGETKAPRVTVRKSVVAATSNAKERAKTVVEGLPAILRKLGYEVGPENFALGHTKVFTKFAAVKPLDDARHFALKSVATAIQSAYRGYIARCRIQKRKQVQAAMNALINPVFDAIGKPRQGGGKRRRTTDGGSIESINLSMDVDKMKDIMEKLVPLLQEAEALDFENEVVGVADWVHRRIRRELAAIESCKRLRSSVEIMEIEKCLQVCSRLQLPDFPARQELSARLKTLQVQKPLVIAIQAALRIDQADEQVRALKEVLKQVENAGLREDVGGWLADLHGAALMSQVLSTLAEASDAVEKELLAKEREEAQKKASEQADAEAEALKQASKKAMDEAETSQQALMQQKDQMEEYPQKKEHATSKQCIERVISNRGRRSIPGALVSERSQILALLRIAEKEFDADNLEMLLNWAAEDGYTDSDEDDTLASAKRRFLELHNTDVMEEYLEGQEDNAERSNPELDGLVVMYNLLKQFRKIGADVDTRSSARKLEQALITLAANQRLRSIFDSENTNEVELAQKLFGDLGNFSELKEASSWAGTTAVVYPMQRKRTTSSVARKRTCSQMYSILDKQSSSSPAEIASIDKKAINMMLSHTRDCIAESMTCVPEGKASQEEYDSGACLNFINLLAFMMDRPAQDCQRQSCHDAVLDLAKQSHMRDEIYCQVLKQLRDNQDERSLRLGWEMLYHLCSSTPPSAALREFVLAFSKDQQEKLLATPDMAEWAEVATNNVINALGGRSLWKRVGDLWDTVAWFAEATGSAISHVAPSGTMLECCMEPRQTGIEDPSENVKEG